MAATGQDGGQPNACRVPALLRRYFSELFRHGRGTVVLPNGL